MNSEKQNRIGLDYFPVNYLSIKNKNQLLKSTWTKNATEIFNNPLYIPKNSKKESKYIDSLQKDMKFSLDVTAERCAHLLPYEDRYYDTLYYVKSDLKNKKSPITKKVHPLPVSHRCVTSIKATKVPELPPVRQRILSRDLPEVYISNGDAETFAVGLQDRPKKQWDEFILSLMSPGTAQYLAFEASRDETQSLRLQELVEKWYGAAPPYRELIPEDIENESVNQDIQTTFPYKYYMDLVKGQRSGERQSVAPEFKIDPTPKQKISDLLSREISFSDENHQTDPYGDDTKASFYRLPLFMRRQHKNTEVLTKDSCNKTTQNLKDFQLPSTPPRRLDTVFNPKVGDKVLTSTNQFQQDLLINLDNKQKKMLNTSDDVIMLEDKLYKKSLQPIWPITVTARLPSDENLDSFKPLRHTLFKGHNRWTNLPEKEEFDLEPIKETNEGEEKARLESRKRVRDHSSVNLIVDQWRKKWQLTQKYNDSTVEALLKDMVDAHPTIRMQAVVTVAKSSAYSTSTTDCESLGDGDRKETVKGDSVPNVLLESIEILLDDSHIQVRKVAAVALHSFERQTEKSLQILRSMLKSGSNVDRWTAAQCLALSGTNDSHVIGELVDQLMNSEDFLVHKKASILLSKISFHTKLVHGMLGERLNTVSWRQRIIICKTLPLLHGSLNKDILRKLIYLMWQDQHRQVRIAASQVIGKTGNGKAVHDELIKKLEDQSEVIRADALEKIGILKVMTTRMMPAFLKCFSDDFVIVRKEVCRTCYRLEIQDELCVRKMLDLARYDHAAKVKVCALRALGKICLENSEIREFFVWALLYESEVAVRYEALQSLLALKNIDQELVEILKSRFLIEDDKSIVRLLKKALGKVGINPDEDIDTVAEVKSEVRRFLSDKGHITDVILTNEAEEDYTLHKELMIAPPPEIPHEYFHKEGSSKSLRVSFLETDDSFVQFSTREHEDELEDEHLINDVSGRPIDQVQEREDSSVNQVPEDDNDVVKEEEIEGIRYEKTGSEIGKEALIENADEEQMGQVDGDENLGYLEGNVSADVIEGIKMNEVVTSEKDIENKEEGHLESDVTNDDDEKESGGDDNDTEVREMPTMDNASESNVGLVSGSSEVGQPLGGDEATTRSHDEGVLTEEKVTCSYRLPIDSSHINTRSLERSMTLMTLETPVIVTDLSQTVSIEHSLSMTVMDQVYDAIEFEGIDCGPLELI